MAVANTIQDTQPLSETPMPSGSPESDRKEDAVPVDSEAIEKETQPRATEQPAASSVPPHLRPGFSDNVLRRSQPLQPRVRYHEAIGRIYDLLNL